MKYASIVPLIGGETIAMQNVFKKKPEYILSYEDFKANDNHLVEYYKGTVPYHVIGSGGYTDLPSVDVVNTVCPCAGLSSLNPSASSDAAINDWMPATARYVLGTIKPKVFWGENAPRFASKVGRPIRENLRQIGEENGYVFSVYKTKSILHGLGQVRDRSFYFFWKGKKVPKLEYIKRGYERIEDTIRSVKRDPKDQMNVLTNSSIPSQNPYYRYVLEELEGGISHKEFQDTKIKKSINVLTYIESKTKYDKVSKWMFKNGFDRDAAKCERIHRKLESGGNIMRKNIEFPKDHIGAFVGHLPTMLTHPDEDRFLTVRECLSIMKMPEDFILQGGIKNANHICQNVPVTTAQDMAENVLRFCDGRLDNQMIETDFVMQDNKTRTLKVENNPLRLDEFML
tara:strand:- start:198 stop:1394 length:1197 start_codon:yes stop_codon:yes gene_type:complete